MKLNWCLVFTLMIACFLDVDAQRLDYRQGEILVELNKSSSPSRTISLLKLEFGDDVVFTTEQVIAEPMNIWKIGFNFAKLNQSLVLRVLKRMPTIKNAQNNHLISNRAVPNDPEFNEQWQYINIGNDGGLVNADLDIDDAWDITTGGIAATGDTIVVCVIDDGLDESHEDFEGNLWVNTAEIPENGIDDDNNGYVDDYRGWDTYDDNDNIYQEGSHGTPVAGIIGAKGNNGLGVTGVNWDVKLMIVRGGGDEANALASYAYPYAMRKKYNDSDGAEGAFVVATNSSWGIDFGQAEDAPLWCNFYDSLGMIGILNCGATINSNVNVDIQGDLPTSCGSDFLISVSNVTRNFEKEDGAGFGTLSIDIGAFGSDTYTTAFGNSYDGFGGTSAATPHVTGAIALLYALPYSDIMELAKSNPSGAALLMRNVILNSARKDQKFVEQFNSSGVLNLRNAVNLMQNIFSDCAFPFAIETQNLNLDTTRISWEENENVQIYNLRYKPISDTIWTTIEDVSSPVDLVDLGTCNTFEVQIQSICDADSTSDYSFSKNFTSLGCCEAPAGLLGNSDPEEVPESSIFVSWNYDQDHENYIIEYNQQGDGEILSIETDTNFILLENLAFCSAYEIRILADCITGEPTPVSDTLVAATSCGRCTTLEYCFPPVLTTFGEWIDTVIIDGQVAATGENFGYQDNAGLFDIDLRIGTEIELKVIKGFGDATFNEWVKVWIDINTNGIFDEDELYFDEGEATPFSIDTSILIQADISPGLTRMRVGMVYEDEPIPCDDPDILLEFGEYEDYCVNLVGPCDYGLGILDLTPAETEATVTFSPVDTSIAYNVRYKQVGQGDDEWETISVLDTTAMISSLEECTDYVLQVRAVCLVDTSGFEAVTDTFRTIGADCMVNVDDLALSPIQITAFPNPFLDRINLKVQSEIESEVVIQILSMDGKQIGATKKFLNQGENRILVNESQNWNAGIYFIRIKGKSIDNVVKVIKLGL